MKKYVFSFMSLFDNDLTSVVVESSLPVLTITLLELGKRGWNFDDVPFDTIDNLDKLKNVAFEGECVFEIIEV